MCIYIYEKRQFKYERHTSISLNILFQTKTQTKYYTQTTAHARPTVKIQL